MRRVAEGLQLLGDPKRSVAIAARVADEDIGHALPSRRSRYVRYCGNDILGVAAGEFKPSGTGRRKWRPGALAKLGRAHHLDVFISKNSSFVKMAIASVSRFFPVYLDYFPVWAEKFPGSAATGILPQALDPSAPSLEESALTRRESYFFPWNREFPTGQVPRGRWSLR
jgi:hypothetical protein